MFKYPYFSFFTFSLRNFSIFAVYMHTFEMGKTKSFEIPLFNTSTISLTTFLKILLFKWSYNSYLEYASPYFISYFCSNPYFCHIIFCYAHVVILHSDEKTPIGRKYLIRFQSSQTWTKIGLKCQNVIGNIPYHTLSVTDVDIHKLTVNTLE